MTTVRIAVPPRIPLESTPALPILHPATYVPLPRRLLEDLRDSPTAIGVYAVLGRLSQLTGAPIPLSAADLHAYDPSLSYGAARRALDRLVDTGYALVTPHAGRKGHYVPTWGRIQGTPRPWDHAAGHVGRPRHLAVYRLDDRLLDLCMGTLRPHATHAALIKRYLVTPLLTLRDVGAYALALVGIPFPSPTLESLGLRDAAGRPQALPEDATILAIASQRAAATGTGGLTPEGWQRVGVAPVAAPAASATPLFFVPPEVIGGMIGNPDAPLIGHLIGMPAVAHPSNCPSACAIPAPAPAASASHGSDGKNTSNPPTPMDGGGTRSAPDSRPAKKETCSSSPTAAELPTAAPDADASVLTPIPSSPAARGFPAAEVTPTAVDAPTESERRLQALGVRGDVARTLADRPPAQVERVIAYVQARPGVRDRAAWVVSALRALPPEDAPPAPPPVSLTPILHHPTLTPQERMVWLRRFRSADPADRPAVLARFHAAHPQEPPHDACA